MKSHGGAGLTVCRGALRCASNGGEVLQNMKLRLFGQAQCRPGIERVNRRSLDATDIGQAGAMRRLQLLIELRDIVTRRNEQIPVESSEIVGR